MSAPTSPESPFPAANALLAHLRQHPEDAARPASELAARFGLDVAFVRSVLEAVRLPRPEPAARPAPRRISFDRLRHGWTSSAALFERMTADPVRFLLVSVLAAVALCIAFRLIGHRNALEVRRSLMANWGVLTTLVVVFLLHMTTYYRKGMSRYPLIGGLIVWVASAATAMVAVWLQTIQREPLDRLMFVMVAALAMFMLSLVYTGCGAAVALLGGYVHARVEQQRDEEMTRQELLERYFELQTRLAAAGSPAPRGASWLDEALPTRLFRRAPIPFVVVASATLTLSQMAVETLRHVAGLGMGGSSLTPLQLVVLAFEMALAASTVLFYIGVGLLSAGVLRALALSFLGELVGAAVTLLPIGKYGLRAFVSIPNLFSQGINVSFFLAVAAFAAVGGEIQRRSTHEASLRSNDAATIVAEMLRIQWRLADHSSNVCVMVVDAAKSSMMKADADPLEVEYSFREYQEWLEEISRPLGGRVHSTAGDGAVIAFSDCGAAFRAARRIQTDLDRFNRNVNRLSLPFRLRIGLHVGQVVGELDKVRFTEVIDIAAHIQGAAPVAGIAASDAVVASLAEEEFVPLAKEIDGHKVFLALNPTEDF